MRVTKEKYVLVGKKRTGEAWKVALLVEHFKTNRLDVLEMMVYY